MTMAGLCDLPKDCLGLGVGMDLPWGEKIGYERKANGEDGITLRVERFLHRYGQDFNYIFFAFQPRDRQVLSIDNYAGAYESLFDAAPDHAAHALHQTMLNMGALEHYDRQRVIKFTNDIIERFDIKWVVEDVGIWSIKGKVLPYPLAPLLTVSSLKKNIDNVKECRDGIHAPLSIEFPGFTDGTNFFIGTMNAFDFFAELAEKSDTAVTIDIGHILSYLWLTGVKGETVYKEVTRLPLERCFEIHLSGCSIVKGRLRDAHHGILLDEQLDMLEYLIPLCSNLKACTYEDPKYTEDGVLIDKSIRNYKRLKNIVSTWQNNLSGH